MAVLLPALIANRGLRYFQSHANVRSTTHRCRPNFSLLSLCPFLLYGSLSRAFSGFLCTFCRRKFCRREVSRGASSACREDA